MGKTGETPEGCNLPSIEEKIPHAIIKMGSRSDRHFLVFLGDLHYGSRAADKELMRKCVGKIGELCVNNSVSVFLMGDIFESFAIRDTRFDWRNVDPDILRKCQFDYSSYQMVCIEEVAQLLRPIARNILYILEGNHEDKLRRMNDISPTIGLLHELRKYNSGIKGGLFSTYFALFFRRFSRRGERLASRVVVLYLTHGFGGGRTEGTAVNRISELGHTHDADIIVAGHYHQFNWSVGAKFNVMRRGVNLKLQAQPQYRLLTPSFFRTYATGMDTYASKRGYRPTVLGTVGIELIPMRGNGETTPPITAQQFTIELG